MDKVRATGDHRWIARCPAHEDRRPSLGISELPDGRILIHCFAGCDSGDILAAINLTFSDLFPHRIAHDLKPARRPFDVLQVYNCVVHEILVVSVIAEDLSQGLPLTESLNARIRLAAQRLLTALVSMGELPASEELKRIRQRSYTV